VIDLHLHTTASDGLLAPAALVGRAAAAGLCTIAVTDHDTVAGLDEAVDAGRTRGVRVVAGIEMTAVEDGNDVHVLGYFIDPDSAILGGFLIEQRVDRVRRVREMGERLRNLGMAVDVEALIATADADTRSIGRPAIADALVAAGQAVDRTDAFTRLLGRGRPAFVPRRGVTATAAIEMIHAAGGIASLAHPGISASDSFVEALAGHGLDAIEVWHSDHSPDQQRHYSALADRLCLAKSGGSDFHGDGVHHAARLGGVLLPEPEFQRLEAASEKRR
jgi:predicted metal-dependent phosphoesterase TrpH